MQTFCYVLLDDVFSVTFTEMPLYIFYKHMKFRNQARLCWAIYDFEARIMLNYSRYRTTGTGKI